MFKILYVHGFRSSGNSGTANTIRDLLEGSLVIAPDLPVNANEALSLLQDIVEQEEIDVVVGTSMGGMLAQKLRGIHKILVNPSFHVSETFRRNMGVVEYFKQRADGISTFEITPEIVESYRKLEKDQFKDITQEEKDITIGVFGNQDDTVNCLDEFKTYYTKIVHFDGGHRLNEKAIRECIIPNFKRLLCKKT